MASKQIFDLFGHILNQWWLAFLQKGNILLRRKIGPNQTRIIIFINMSYHFGYFILEMANFFETVPEQSPGFRPCNIEFLSMLPNVHSSYRWTYTIYYGQVGSQWRHSWLNLILTRFVKLYGSDVERSSKSIIWVCFFQLLQVVQIVWNSSNKFIMLIFPKTPIQ